MPKKRPTTRRATAAKALATAETSVVALNAAMAKGIADYSTGLASQYYKDFTGLVQNAAGFGERGAKVYAKFLAACKVLELAEVTQKYGENVLDATNAYELLVDDVARLGQVIGQLRAVFGSGNGCRHVGRKR